MSTSADAVNAKEGGSLVAENYRRCARGAIPQSGTTTIRVSVEASKKWRQWCKVKKMTSEELMDKLIEKVGLRHQQSFYNSLPDPRKIKIDKHLSYVRLQKLYTKISGT
jgi:hypothetical protein